MTRIATQRHQARQRGAATLVVVMVLFFLVLLVAAYSARTLIFEQRTSANQYRSAQAYEAAQGGLEWTLAMLNSNQRIDNDCLPTQDPSFDTFRDRYLAVEVDNGRVRPATTGVGRFAGCTRTQQGWRCKCPSSAEMATLASEPTSSSAFIVAMRPWLSSTPAEPLRVSSRACSSGNDQRCYSDGTSNADAISTQSMQVALVPVVRQPPIAAVTVFGDASAPPSSVLLVNQDVGGSSLTLHAGGSITGTPTVVVPGGVPPETTVRSNDSAMGGQLRYFSSFMGVSQTTYRKMPVVSNLNCQAQACDSALLAAAGAGSRLFYVAGDLTLPAGTTLGSPDKPVLLAVEGRLTLQGLTQINGLVYALGLGWLNAATASSIRGGVIVRDDCCAGVTGSAQLVYDHDVLTRLQLSAGAYARVPGSWQDR